MSVDTGELFLDMNDEGGEDVALPAGGTQTVSFSPGHDPMYDGSGLPRGDNPPPSDITGLLAEYSRSLQAEVGNPDLGEEAEAALQRFREHLGTTGMSESLQN